MKLAAPRDSATRRDLSVDSTGGCRGGLFNRSFGKLLFVAVLSTAAFGIGTAALAEDWPQFRGPTGMGLTTERGLPIEWDGAKGKNVAWKVKLPGAVPDASADHNQSSPDRLARSDLCDHRVLAAERRSWKVSRSACGLLCRPRRQAAVGHARSAGAAEAERFARRLRRPHALDRWPTRLCHLRLRRAGGDRLQWPPCLAAGIREFPGVRCSDRGEPHRVRIRRYPVGRSQQSSSDAHRIQRGRRPRALESEAARRGVRTQHSGDRRASRQAADAHRFLQRTCKGSIRRTARSSGGATRPAMSRRRPTRMVWSTPTAAAAGQECSSNQQGAANSENRHEMASRQYSRGIVLARDRGRFDLSVTHPGSAQVLCLVRRQGTIRQAARGRSTSSSPIATPDGIVYLASAGRSYVFALDPSTTCWRRTNWATRRNRVRP